MGLGEREAGREGESYIYIYSNYADLTRYIIFL